jgi:hypothetical protein
MPLMQSAYWRRKMSNGISKDELLSIRNVMENYALTRQQVVFLHTEGLIQFVWRNDEPFVIRKQIDEVKDAAELLY